MRSRRHVTSYYQATAVPAPQRAALAEPVDCDICVVGGGIAGCSTALHLAERGYRVVLLEKHRIGWGASGRSGGQVLPGTAAGQEELERLLGPSLARAVWDICLEGVALVRSLIERYAIACDWVSGHLQVALRPRQVQEIHGQLTRLTEQYRYRSARSIGREELQSIIATKRYLAALYDANSGHLHPLNYTLGLAAAAEIHGARLYEESRALDFAGDAARITVRTARAEVRCRFLALCGNAHLGETAPELRSKIMAVGSCLVATAPLGPERARGLIENDAAVADMNWVLDYFRRSADDRLLFGGRVTYSGFDPARIAASTRRRLLGVFPQLEDVPLEFAWGGYLDITLNRAPHFGRLAPNVYFLQGFSGHGLALAGIAGRLLADAIAGHAERFDVFARIPHRNFPGGRLLRRPALVVAMLYYRLKDLL